MRDSEVGQEKQRCRICGQLKPISQYGMHNGRLRPECWTCRSVRRFRRKEDEREQRVKRCYLALGREIRRGWGNSKRTAELLDQLQHLCGGNLKMVAEQWGEFLAETAGERPGTPRALKGLVTVAEVLRLAKQAERDVAASQTAGKKHKGGPARRSDKPPDFSAWTDEQLEEAIRQRQKERETPSEEITMVSLAKQNFVFQATNIHAAGCGEPPAITNVDSARYYHGYFEGASGDQWVFLYDRQTGKGTLRGGDVGWDEEVEVVDGTAPELILDEKEWFWLKNCWNAATGETPSRPEVDEN